MANQIWLGTTGIMEDVIRQAHRVYGDDLSDARAVSKALIDWYILSRSGLLTDQENVLETLSRLEAKIDTLLER